MLTHDIPGYVIEEARQGRPWWHLWIKQELRALHTNKAFEEFRSIVRLPATVELELKRIESLRAAALNYGEEYVEIEPPGEPIVNEPPRVLGAGNHRTLAGISRSMYLTAFSEVTTRGRSGLIGIQDLVLLDYEGNELQQIKDELELDIAIFRTNGKSAWIIENNESPATFIYLDQAFTLLGPNTFAFGHWMAEYLPKLMIAMESGILPVIPILIDAEMPKQHRQSLELLLPSGWEILEVRPMQIVRARKMWCASTVYYAPVAATFDENFCYELVAVPPARFVRIIDRMLERMLPGINPMPGPQRIFLARKPERHRKLVNYEKIEMIAQEFGFVRIYPEDLDFSEQLRLLRSARFIAGPEGSAFFLTLFTHSPAKICILNHQHTAPLPLWTALMTARGMDVTVITGPYKRKDSDLPHSDYEIDEEYFSSFMDNWVRA